MRATLRNRAFLRGVGSLVNLMPSSNPYAAAQRRFTRRLPDISRHHLAQPGERDNTVANAAALVAWAESLAAHPGVLPADGVDVQRIEELLAAAEQTPPVVERFSPVGNLWIDAARLAEDRYRVRKQLVAAVGNSFKRFVRAAMLKDDFDRSEGLQPNPPVPPILPATRYSLYVGPLPHPDILREYEALAPGYAKKLAAHHLRSLKQSLDLELQEATQRQQAARAEQTAVIHDMVAEREVERVGQRAGAIAALAALSLCGWLAWLGHPTEAMWVGLSVPASLLTAFLYGRYRETTEPLPPNPS